MADDVLLTERRGDAAVLTLHRPDKLNALSHAVEVALDAALGGDIVGGARAVVIAGAGRAFSAGADVTEFPDQDPGAIVRYYEGIGNVFERLRTVPVPTIAAIHGYCLGGGLELALACDFRVADRTAVFGLPEVDIGIVPSSGGTVALTRLVGPGRAKELILLRDRFGAEQALRFGVVTEVVDEGDALPTALTWAGEIAAKPPLAVRVAKTATDAAAEASREAALQVERTAYAMLAQTADADEAARAFIEKREPRFEGR
jgi:enoyl-CoA hydratase/carnithine racemase